jgi:hypothetical protein
MSVERSITDDDTTWRDWYDGAEELAEHVEQAASARMQAGDYGTAIHLAHAAAVLRELDDRVAELEASA